MVLRLVLCALALSLAGLAASMKPLPRKDCTGTISSDYEGDIYIGNMTTCYITDGVTIKGSIYMSNASNLQCDGEVNIKGSYGILGINAGWVNLYGHTTVEKIDMFNGTGDAHVTLYGAEVGLGGLKLEASKGDMKICGSTIDDVMEYKECEGNLIVYKDWYAIKGLWGCTPSRFINDVKVEAITGDVWLKDTTVEGGEFNVKSVLGKTYIKSSEFNVVKLELNVGEVTVDDVEAGETEIKENINGVKIWNSMFSKITCVDNAPGVAGYGNEFALSAGQCAASSLSA